MTVKVRRSLVKTFLNTGTLLSPVWSLIGDGVAAAKIGYSPKVTDETWIHQTTADISVDSYAPKMPIEMVVKEEDPAFIFIDALRYSRAILDDAATQIVNVYLYQTPSLNFYQAEIIPVTISIDDFGGDGGNVVKINYTINYAGVPVQGEFNPTTVTFTAQPILAVLATMAISVVTLSPLFATNKEILHYSATTPHATASVTMSSTCIAAGAVVVQKNGVTVINQAGAATLADGVNHLTIQVTVGTEVVTYCIDITRTVT
jgi:hypothetical protein